MCLEQKIRVTANILSDLKVQIEAIPHDKLFVLTDRHTHMHCLPKVAAILEQFKYEEIVIEAEDTHKNIESLTYIWQYLSDHQGTRHSLMINLGGGMITDIGGFAAATFKRGIPCINIPTTLLAMVDAAVGGKTGINFNGLKNEIGVFSTPRVVLLDTAFLLTLDEQNICSGYGEVLKHSLLANEAHYIQVMEMDLHAPDLHVLRTLVQESVLIKKKVVEQDPTERGIRKALNLGHTVGHAFESLALEQNRHVLHGYAVAWGLVCELYLSHVQCNFPLPRLRQISQYIQSYYGQFSFSCKDVDRLIELMMHDKKNVGHTINFTLLGDIGDIRIDQTASKEMIMEMLEFYREGL